MTGQEAIDHLSYFTQYDIGLFYGASPTNAQKMYLINWAARLMALKIKLYRPDLELTLTADTYRYNLQDLTIVERKVIEPYGVYINGNRLRNQSGQRPGLWPMAELERQYPAFWTHDADVPARAAFMAPDIYLHPKPSASVVSAGNNFLAATVFPLDRTADSDVSTGLSTQLDLPLQLHEACVFLAAVKGGVQQASENDAWQRLQAYNSEWIEIAQQIATKNANDLAEWQPAGNYMDARFRIDL